MQLKATHITIQILITVINNHSYQNIKTLNLLRVWIIQAPSLSQPCMCNNCDGGGRITLLKPHRSHNYMNNHFGHLAHFIVPNCIVCTLFGTCTWTIAPFHTILLLWSTLFESLNTSALMAGDPISKFPSKIRFEIPKNYWCLPTNQPTDEQAKFFKEMNSNVETECKTLTWGLSGSRFTALSGGGARPSCFGGNWFYDLNFHIPSNCFFLWNSFFLFLNVLESVVQIPMSSFSEMEPISFLDNAILTSWLLQTR